MPRPTPLAPISSIYRGSKGDIIPMPSVAEKTQRARMGKTFFIMRVPTIIEVVRLECKFASMSGFG